MCTPEKWCTGETTMDNNCVRQQWTLQHLDGYGAHVLLVLSCIVVINGND